MHSSLSPRHIKSVSIGIIPISILCICVNQRQSIVICGKEILFFLPQIQADKHRLTQMNYIVSGCTIIDISFSIESRTANSQQSAVSSQHYCA
jgi:hypothetical protein